MSTSAEYKSSLRDCNSDNDKHDHEYRAAGDAEGQILQERSTRIWMAIGILIAVLACGVIALYIIIEKARIYPAPVWPDNPHNYHLIAHSHDDLGWIVSEDDYSNLMVSRILRSSAKYVADNADAKFSFCNGTNNASEFDSSLFSGGLENLSRYSIRGIKAQQIHHVFGSVNNTRKRLSNTIKDEIDVIEQCFARVKALGSESTTFFQTLDVEAWTLVNSWGQVFSGLSSRRCISASIINGTGYDIQIKATKLVEGGSPCYSIPSKEFDAEQGVLHPGGAIIFFGWGVVPNLLQAGNVFMNIETNAFVSDLSDHKSRDAYAMATAGYKVGFLEKSFDESGWWAKYWLLVTMV